jgi:S-formylglutathione hydrolase
MNASLYVKGACNIEGETDRWDFGAGAGFYIDALEPKWKTNYRMYSYVNSELHDVLRKNWPIENISIFGHRLVSSSVYSEFKLLYK